MKVLLKITVALLVAQMTWLPAAAQTPTASSPSTNEPAPAALWLEDSSSAATQDWVRQRNDESEQRLLRDPRYPAELQRLRAIARLGHGDEYLNGGLLHRMVADERHPLGTWQARAITPAARQLLGRAGWVPLLSLDDLARLEGAAPGQGARFRPGWLNPMCDTTAGPRCVLHLSPDGGDRTAMREFDLRTRRLLPADDARALHITTPARTYAHWVDGDQLLVASDFGASSLSSAGYALQWRLWPRGTPLASARLLFQAPADAVLFIPHAFRSSRGHFFVAEVWRGSGATEWWHVDATGRQAAVQLQLPVDVVRYHGVEGIVQDRLVLLTAQPLAQGEHTWPAGSLLAVPLPDDAAPGRVGRAELIHAPASDEAVDAIFHLAVADDSLWFGLMKNVSGQLRSAHRTPDGVWQVRTHALPPHAALRLLSGEVAPSQVLVRTESLLRPPVVEVRSNHAPTQVVARTPPLFDASRYVTEQYVATSRDGTPVPYYVVRVGRPKTLPTDGSAAALLTAYGGYGVSFLPAYLSSEFQSDLAWTMLAAGGIHVHANIRGGGEFGPAWHRAAQGRNHPRGIEDLAAVAEDLVRRGLAARDRLGFIGASNGGLLAAATAVARPDLFKAVVADVPITDMLRFHELFTGAVWIAEYGDPRVPEDRAVLRSYSPLHNLREGVRYPQMLLTTSSSDDRVHPGHARRFAAALLRLGQTVLFHESRDAGHEGAASVEATARLRAMKAVFLLQALGLREPAP